MTERRTGIYWREIQVKGKGFTIQQKAEEVRDGGKLVETKWFDEVRFKIGGNYGNCIYTDKAGANKVYKAICRGEIEIFIGILDSFKTINAMQKFLIDNGQKCKIACC